MDALVTFASYDPVVASVSFSFNRADFDVRFGSGSFFDDLEDDLISDEVNMPRLGRGCRQTQVIRPGSGNQNPS